VLSPPQSKTTLPANVTDTVTGIGSIYENTRPFGAPLIQFFVPFYSLSLALNILLTLMIVTRLILHSRNTRKLTGGLAGTNGLYKAVVTMLVESCALYAVTYTIFIVLINSDNSAVDIFFPILVEIQVRAVVTFPDTAILGYGCLMAVTNRLSLRSSSLYESPTGVC
jgi:hypothetical protein